MIDFLYIKKLNSQKSHTCNEFNIILISVEKILESYNF
jgi:hypothetical protein